MLLVSLSTFVKQSHSLNRRRPLFVGHVSRRLDAIGIFPKSKRMQRATIGRTELYLKGRLTATIQTLRTDRFNGISDFFHNCLHNRGLLIFAGTIEFNAEAATLTKTLIFNRSDQSDRRRSRTIQKRFFKKNAIAGERRDHNYIKRAGDCQKRRS
jgi:hypothetical protein